MQKSSSYWSKYPGRVLTNKNKKTFLEEIHESEIKQCHVTTSLMDRKLTYTHTFCQQLLLDYEKQKAIKLSHSNRI